MKDFYKNLINDFHIGWEKFEQLQFLNSEEDVRLIISALQRKFGATINHKYSTTYISVFEVDLSEIKIRLSYRTLLCFLKLRRNDTVSLNEAFRSFTTAHHAYAIPGYCTLGILSSGDTKAFKKKCKNSFMDIISLDRDQFCRIIEAEDWANALAAAILEEKAADVLSPYDEVGVCSREMFYGRQKETQQLLTSARQHGIALVGSRRVGKSSMLLAVKQHCDAQGDTTFFIDCESCRDVESFKNEIIKRTNIRDYEFFSGKNWNLKDYLLERLLPQYRGTVNIFLDEIDQLVRHDAKTDYTYMINPLLSAQNESQGRLNLFFAGYKELYWSIDNNLSPLYGKTRIIELGPLDREAATNLIVQPLRHLGFDFRNKKELLSRILEDTNSHPALIQLTCRLLVEYMVLINQTVIGSDHYATVQGFTDYKDYILDTFIIATTPLEKVTILSLLEYNTFTIQEAAEELKKKDIRLSYDRLYKEMRDLRFSGILRENNENFLFNFPVLKAIIRRHINVEYLIGENLRKAREAVDNDNPQSK